MSKIIDLGSLLEKSWKLFKINLFFCLGVGVIFFIMALILDTAANAVPTPYQYLVYLFGAIVLLLLQLGVIKVCLALVDGKQTDYNNLWNNARFIWSYVGASLLTAIPIILGLVLLVLPGVYLYVRWQFFSVLIVDKNLGPIKALKESWRLTTNHVWDSFLLLLITVILTFSGALFYGIGLIFTLPFTMICLSMFYRTLEEKAV